MQNNGTASVITLDSLMNSPIEMPDNAGADSLAELTRTVNHVEEVLPGLDPLEEIVPGDGLKQDATPSDLPPTITPDILDTVLPEAKEEIESSNSLIYKAALKEVFGNEIGAIVQEVDGEEKEFTLDEIDLDKETFADILKSKIEEIKESANRNKISVEGTSDYLQKLIEVEKNGGDISGLLQMKQQLSDPLDGLDLDNPEDQKEIIYLRGSASGQDQADLIRLIKAYEEDGILEEKAQQAYTTLRTAIDAKLNEAVLKAEMDKAAKEEEFKVYKKSVKENLSQFQLNDKVKAKLVDLATKVDEKGQLELDVRYTEARLNPEKAARLALMLFDEEEFIKQVTSKEVTAQKLEGARKLKIVPRSTSIQEPTKTRSSERTVNLSDLL
jgi:hypothetical protein